MGRDSNEQVNATHVVTLKYDDALIFQLFQGLNSMIQWINFKINLDQFIPNNPITYFINSYNSRKMNSFLIANISLMHYSLVINDIAGRVYA